MLHTRSLVKSQRKRHHSSSKSQRNARPKSDLVELLTTSKPTLSCLPQPTDFECIPIEEYQNLRQRPAVIRKALCPCDANRTAARLLPDLVSHIIGYDTQPLPHLCESSDMLNSIEYTEHRTAPLQFVYIVVTIPHQLRMGMDTISELAASALDSLYSFEVQEMSMECGEHYDAERAMFLIVSHYSIATNDWNDIVPYSSGQLALLKENNIRFVNQNPGSILSSMITGWRCEQHLQADATKQHELAAAMGIHLSASAIASARLARPPILLTGVQSQCAVYVCECILTDRETKEDAADYFGFHTLEQALNADHFSLCDLVRGLTNLCLRHNRLASIDVMPTQQHTGKN